MADQTLCASRLARGLAGAGLAAAIALAHGAAAQTMNANSASFNAGFGRTAGEENRPVDVSLTDANGNTTLVNGLLQAPTGSLFGEVRAAVGTPATTSSGGGAGDSFSGAGTGSSASAIGNSLNVVVQGDNNTVIVNSTQTNNGAVTATTSNSGK